VTVPRRRTRRPFGEVLSQFLPACLAVPDRMSTRWRCPFGESASWFAGFPVIMLRLTGNAAGGTSHRPYGGYGGRHGATVLPACLAAAREVIVSERLIAAAAPGYKIGDALGRGGFGLVVAGRHKRLKRDVAIKVVPIEDTVAGRGFATEAELLASLNHPHIVRVHDYLEAEGLGLIVMELLAGGTLARRRDLSQPEACAVGLAVAAGLAHAHAHSRGILHRDIKPGNVLFDADGTVKVGDFGIARMFTGSGTTGTAQGAGTPGYMAPEQIVGGRLTPATDLYSLAVVLYQLLAGVPPFDLSLPPAMLWQLRLTAPPPPLDGVPDSIGAVVLRALAKKPADRYPDADTFATALAGAAVSVYGPGWLAETSLPLHLADPIRHLAAPPPPPPPVQSDGGFGDASTAGPPEPPADTLTDTPSHQDRARRFGGIRRRVLVGAGALAALTTTLLVGLLPGTPNPPNPPTTSELQAWSSQLADASMATTVSDRALARRLAIAAYHTAPTPEARRAVRSLVALTAFPGIEVYAVAFSPDGERLATASSDGTAMWWDATRSGTVDQPLATFVGQTGSFGTVAFSPDGKRLATTSSDGTLMWDLDLDAGRLVTAACTDPAANQLTAAEWHDILPDAPYRAPCP